MPVLLDILACPTCKTPVRAINRVLVCSACRREYSFSAGAPVMLDDESSRALSHAAGVAENRRLISRLRKIPWILALLEAVRPPHPFFFPFSRGHRERFSGLIDGRGDNNPVILDIGGGRSGKLNVAGLSPKCRGGLIVLDIEPGEGVSVVGDAHKLPFVNDSVDGVLAQGVLEHVRDARRLVREINRVLRPGGVVYADLPFLQHYHQDPEDYRRFTAAGFVDFFQGFDPIASGVAAGPASALCDMLTEFAAAWFDHPLFYWGVKWCVGWLVAPIKYLDWFLTRRPRAHIAAGAVYFLGSKSFTTTESS